MCCVVVDSLVFKLLVKFIDNLQLSHMFQKYHSFSAVICSNLVFCIIMCFILYVLISIH